MHRASVQGSRTEGERRQLPSSYVTGSRVLQKTRSFVVIKSDLICKNKLDPYMKRRRLPSVFSACLAEFVVVVVVGGLLLLLLVQRLRLVRVRGSSLATVVYVD